MSTLAAVLVGPYTGALCIAIVLVVQSLLFADGGVTALGTNVTNMAVVGVGALAVYLRTLQSGNSAFDRFQSGDSSALTALQQHGRAQEHRAERLIGQLT